MRKNSVITPQAPPTTFLLQRFQIKITFGFFRHLRFNDCWEHLLFGNRGIENKSNLRHTNTCVMYVCMYNLVWDKEKSLVGEKLHYVSSDLAICTYTKTFLRTRQQHVSFNVCQKVRFFLSVILNRDVCPISKM